MRGLRPKYRLGRYGPHNKVSFKFVECAIANGSKNSQKRYIESELVNGDVAMVVEVDGRGSIRSRDSDRVADMPGRLLLIQVRYNILLLLLLLLCRRKGTVSISPQYPRTPSALIDIVLRAACNPIYYGTACSNLKMRYLYLRLSVAAQVLPRHIGSRQARSSTAFPVLSYQLVGIKVQMVIACVS